LVQGKKNQPFQRLSSVVQKATTNWSGCIRLWRHSTLSPIQRYASDDKTDPALDATWMNKSCLPRQELISCAT